MSVRVFVRFDDDDMGIYMLARGDGNSTFISNINLRNIIDEEKAFMAVRGSALRWGGWVILRDIFLFPSINTCTTMKNSF